jgi:hypothetical protein
VVDDLACRDQWVDLRGIAAELRHRPRMTARSTTAYAGQVLRSPAGLN